MSVILNHLHAPIVYGQLTYPFELVGFFFASGYTFKQTKSFSTFFRKNIKTLLIPVVLLGLINAILSHYTKGGAFVPLILGIIEQRAGFWDFIWFVPCLFVTKLIFYPIVRSTLTLLRKVVICLIISGIGYILIIFMEEGFPWHIENACVMLVFLCLGHVVQETRFVDLIKANLQTNQCACFFLSVLFFYILLVFSIKNFPIDIHLRQYGCFSAFMISACFGLYIIFCLSLYLEHWNKAYIVRLLQYIGNNTLVFYAFQSKVISFLNIIGDKIGFYSSTYIGSIIYCLLVSFILMIPSYLIRRHAPILLGRF